ncbi:MULTISPECIES: minor capsid protein [unclassified Facklamia]|uniref:minor capsid protein n=1 Tax=Aerococcaceae TaxID=186827 RepID=UPI0013B92102|nr:MULTISPECIES: minor capsid protein [unclassified Facklamia]NEW64255.1 capsid protein [Facklamia sp. 252]NEW68770.1 capsid protein [Facklamia sp. 253]QQD64721.1 capsid protein [Aerococcaceae bacterium zg-252]
MGVEVKVDLKKLEAKVGPAAVVRGRIAMINQALLDMDRYVPRYRGDLRASASATKEGVKYSAVYARRVYYGKKNDLFYTDKQRRCFFANLEEIKKYKKTPGTSARWDKKVPAETKKQWGIVALRAMGVNP